ncbi:MAG TPA: ABC transporter permease [Chloroflexus aurantiacus]|uniref:Autoinducer 2 import system permease protein LsrD n=1 Tax=Chloroflexus aurantiacus (strain ATCC 29366 / DSM 635 / J-10-fl) TaxID=324602 RepID=A9WGG4_CHLAA|nr:ABC transporter permease [Chloroflexus aurantiacus]ABY35496.1 Monosaccharide-transporting ATPase [Chloroflexus aurantiacus J-10-fl]HBW69449.1 ABC transporter permease [Chloroflexus aurantiacus]
MNAKLRRLLSWEGLLLAVLLLVAIINTNLAPAYVSLNNQINLFQLSIEKIIVALVMTFIIINGEIDLSVASVMGLAACIVAVLFEQGIPMELAIVVALLAGALCGAFNGFWVAYVGLPSLAVTLAGMIGFRGVARILIEDRSIGGFPAWFTALGQQPLIGPFPFSLIVFGCLFAIAFVVLQYSGVGRLVYVVGHNAAVARYSGIDVARLKLGLFVASGLIAALAGILLAARLGAVRGNTADGFELDIITMVLLGGVSIFGGVGNLVGVGLSILVILNLRNGMSLLNVTGNVQTGVVGLLLILSVLLPNLAQIVRERWQRRIVQRKEVPAEIETSVSS